MERALDRGLASSARVMAAAVWLSAMLFGIYILIFYALAVVTDDLARWNATLPSLHVPDGHLGNAGMALHFAGGGGLLVLGSIQFIEAVRARIPRLHRFIGRIYVASALAAGVGGLVFIAARGTVGGVWMDLGFGLYGALMVVAAVQTGRYAAARRLSEHRAWAVRLYALAIGSWLYRMDYGFWFLLTDGWGHTPTFDGPVDHVMDFAFFLPNLVVAEAWLRASGSDWSNGVKLAAIVGLCSATGFVLLATWFFATEVWLPQMQDALTGINSPATS